VALPSNHTDDLRLAHVLADDADSLTTSRFKAMDLHVVNKPDLTPVTDADKSVEEGIRRTLSRARPRDAVLGEEQGTTGHGNRCWIVDPIDGTKNFVRGVPVWATLIGLMVDGEVVVGCVSAPLLNRRWWASAGGEGDVLERQPGGLRHLLQGARAEGQRGDHLEPGRVREQPHDRRGLHVLRRYRRGPAAAGSAGSRRSPTRLGPRDVGPGIL
jgi:fructose-1,6-bisphosphatase/inositol monophosphatase family enzyme